MTFHADLDLTAEQLRALALICIRASLMLDPNPAPAALGLEYIQEPHGWFPVQARFRLSDGRIGYYRARGAVSVTLWPSGTEWGPSGGLPDANGTRVYLGPWADELGLSNVEHDPTTADPIIRAWLADGAPTNLVAALRAERQRSAGLHELVVQSAAAHQRDVERLAR